MRKVALTGGIGTGKSRVVGLLRRRSVPTIDADQVSRAVVEPGSPAHAALRSRFGAALFGAGGQLDRRALGTIVFDDAAARADLEAIVHPRVRETINAWFRRCAETTAATFAVADIPLLFETGHTDAYDQVVVVACDPEVQVARVMTRDGLPEADVRKRIAAQLPIEEKVAHADWVVRTDGSYEETARQVDAVYRELTAPSNPRTHFD